MSTFTIPTIYTAVDKFSTPVKAMERANASFGAKLDNVSAKSERLFKKLTPGLSDATKQMAAMAGTAALVGAAIGTAAFSTKAIMDYEDAVQKFRTIVSDLNDQDFSKYEKAIGMVARNTKKSTIEVANSFEMIAGLNADFAKTAEGLSAVSEAAITLAKASKDELGTSASNLVGILNQFSLGATEADRVINVLAAGQAVGASSITQTAEAFTVFGAVAKQSNLSLEQSVALTEVLASKQIMGSEAGTALRGTLVRLKASGLGYTSGLFNTRDALEEVNAKYKKLKTAKEKDALLDKVFGTINLTTGSILMENVKKFDEFTGSVTATKEAQKAAAINSSTLSNKLDELKNRWINMLTSSDKASKGLNVAKKIIGLLTDNLETIITVGVGFLGFMAAWKIANIVLKGAMIASRAIATAFYIYDMVKYVASTQGITMATAAWEIAQSSLNATLAANPIGLVIVAVAALAYAIYNLYKNWDSVSTLFSTGAAGIARDLNGAWLGIQNSFMTMIENIKLGWSSLQMSLGIISAKEHVNNMLMIKAEQSARTKGIIQNSMVGKAAEKAEGRQILTAFVADAKKNDSDFGTSKMAQVEAGLNATESRQFINPKMAQSQATANAMTNNVVVNNALPGTTVDVNGKKTEAKSSNSLVPNVGSTMTK